MKSGVFDLRAKVSAQVNRGSKKIAQEPRLSLDIPCERGNIDKSPPIRFRIEWAGGQGLVTASWQLAHLNFLIHSVQCESSQTVNAHAALSRPVWIPRPRARWSIPFRQADLSAATFQLQGRFERY